MQFKIGEKCSVAPKKLHMDPEGWGWAGGGVLRNGGRAERDCPFPSGCSWSLPSLRASCFFPEGGI